MTDFQVKDSGERKQYDSGMVRDVEEGKTDYSNVLHGPMFDRWAEHLTKAKTKYPDVAPGVPNWTLAEGPEELARYRRSAFRHLIKWLKGEVDEDHAAAVFFNINGAEYVQGRIIAVAMAPTFEEYFGTDITSPEVEKDRVWVNGTEVDGRLRDEIIESLMWEEANDA